jgi:hypothetical protein
MVIVRLKNKIFIPQFICFLIFFSLLSSEIIVEEDETWGSIEINKSLPYKIELELEQQFRSDDNSQNIYKMFTDVSLSYPLHLFVDISGKFRFILTDDEREKRYGFSIKVDPFDKFYIPSYKLKIQQDYNHDDEPENMVIRNKFTFSLPKLNSFKPSIYYESYHTDGDEGYEYDKYRLSTGIDYTINSDYSVELFYIYKAEIKNKKIEVTNIMGLKFEYTF